MPPLLSAVVLLRDAPAVPTEVALRALRACTPTSVPIDVVDGAAPARVEEALVGSDIVIVEAGVTLADGWLQRLQAAAHADLTTATASALRLEAGTKGSAESTPLPRAWGRPSPRLMAPSPGAVLIRATALELAGPYDEGFAERCAGLSLLHILVPDVPAVVSEDPPPAPETDGREDPLPVGHRRARLWATGALGPIDVTIDGRSLTNTTGGTQVHALELIRALHRTEAVRLRVALPIDPDAAVTEALGALEGVTVVDGSTVTQYTPRTSVVHRTHQVTGAYDLLLLRRLGRRLVVTHQDLIAFHNASYHAEEDLWHSYRGLTAASLQAADLVVTCSDHARADVLAEDLAPDDRVAVVPLGTDHMLPPADAGELPAKLAAVGREPFLLVLGSDLRHKNRPFAIRLLAELRHRHGWAGRLILAGPHVAHGSSAGEEAAVVAESGMSEHVTDLGAVDEAAKSWLLSRAAAVAYPSTYEGFGLIPFEAAAHGTPALFVHGASLADFLPAESALIVPWDVAATAARVAPVLRQREAAAEQVARVLAAGSRLTWDRTAEALVACYQRAMGSPPRDAAATAFLALEAEDRVRRSHDELLRAHDEVRQLHEDVGDIGMLLVGPSGLLPEDAQRALVGLTRRRVTRDLVLNGLTAGRRARRLATARLDALRRRARF